eukprot:scaffold22604_cov130-Cylindrotheca_fusiformis.AAC.1
MLSHGLETERSATSEATDQQSKVDNGELYGNKRGLNSKSQPRSSIMIINSALVLLKLLLFLNVMATGMVSALNVTKLDCGMRHLALEHARNLVSNQQIMDQISDALRMRDLCESEHDIEKASPRVRRRMGDVTRIKCPRLCLYVAAAGDTADNAAMAPKGSVDNPYASIHDAIKHTRLSKNGKPTLILREGVHSLEAKTLYLTSEDRGLSIVGFPGEKVWISGGLAVDVDFEASDNGLFVANLTGLLARHQPIPSVVSLFTTSRRYTRARYPNSDPEVDQWGYASANRLEYSISAEHVLEWHRPEPTSPPNITFVDFFENPPPGVPQKNNSAQRGYNWYTSGHGGACSDVWGPKADSYWCSNASQGGWAEVDAECATTGQVQIPVGMAYNTSSFLKRFQNKSLTGGIIHAWHSQSWAMHMFRISDHSSSGEITFAQGGGRQGGRNWC